MLNLIDILTYYAKFVPKKTLKKVFKQANKSSDYAAIEKTLLNLPEADIVEEIEGFVVSINDNYLTAQVKSCKGTILFIEYGNISLYGDVAQKVSCDIAVTVAAPLANSNSDSIKEALVMNSTLGVLNRIVDKMKEDEGCGCIEHITFPATIMPVPSSSFYEFAGWTAMFKRVE